MKVLHLTNKPVFPLIDGGCIAMYELQKNMLQLGFEVKNLTISTKKHPFRLENFPEKLQNIIFPEGFEIDTTVTAKSAFMSLFNSKSYNISRFYNSEFEKLILSKIIKFNYDVLILETAYLLPYLKSIRNIFKGKILVRTHNVEFKIWERLAQADKNIFKKFFLKKLSSNLKTFEIDFLKKTDGILCISENDFQTFKSLGIHTKIEVVPVSMDLASTEQYVPYADHFFFVGAMNWKPNIEAVDLLLKDIFPKIQEHSPEAKLHLAGSFMNNKLKNHQQKNVVIHGKVKDVKQFMTHHGILLVPLTSGSGIRIKIIEALSVAVPVISTTIGFEGIPVVNNVHGIIAKTTTEIAQMALELTKNQEKAQQLGLNGQKMVTENYSRQEVSKKLNAFIQSI